MKGECPEWFDNWDPNLPLAQVRCLSFVSKVFNFLVIWLSVSNDIICLKYMERYCHITNMTTTRPAGNVRLRSLPSIDTQIHKYNQEMLGWGAYLPLPGFDKKGRMVLLCQMEVAKQICSKNYFHFFLQTINPAKINFNHLMWYCQMVISTAVKVKRFQTRS